MRKSQSKSKSFIRMLLKKQIKFPCKNLLVMPLIASLSFLIVVAGVFSFGYQIYAPNTLPDLGDPYPECSSIEYQGIFVNGSSYSLTYTPYKKDSFTVRISASLLRMVEDGPFLKKEHRSKDIYTLVQTSPTKYNIFYPITQIGNVHNSIFCLGRKYEDVQFSEKLDIENPHFTLISPGYHTRNILVNKSKLEIFTYGNVSEWKGEFLKYQPEVHHRSYLNFIRKNNQTDVYDDNTIVLYYNQSLGNFIEGVALPAAAYKGRNMTVIGDHLLLFQENLVKEFASEYHPQNETFFLNSSILFGYDYENLPISKDDFDKIRKAHQSDLGKGKTIISWSTESEAVKQAPYLKGTTVRINSPETPLSEVDIYGAKNFVTDGFDLLRSILSAQGARVAIIGNASDSHLKVLKAADLDVRVFDNIDAAAEFIIS